MNGLESMAAWNDSMLPTPNPFSHARCTNPPSCRFQQPQRSNPRPHCCLHVHWLNARHSSFAPCAADTLGHRTGVVVGCAIMIIGVALICIGFHVALFIVGRLILGFGIVMAHVSSLHNALAMGLGRKQQLTYADYRVPHLYSLPNWYTHSTGPSTAPSTIPSGISAP